MALPERWLTVDPGEDTGWAIWSGEEFLDHGTDKMWEFGDCVWAEALRQLGTPTEFQSVDGPTELEQALDGISLIVLENWALYPWVLKTGAMDWDECRTARLIGSLFQVCRMARWGYEQQGALIKERAMAAGAGNFFSHPLRENRHANDATMHGIYRIALEQKAKWTDLSNTSWVVPSDA